jgi:thioredoxin 1
MTVKELSESEFDKYVKEGNSVIDFWAEWCAPCKMLGPEIEKASNNVKNVKFAKVNVDGNQSLAGRFQVFSIPTVIFFKGSRQVDRFSGSMRADEIENRVKKVFG